jgi:hypothetical protein
LILGVSGQTAEPDSEPFLFGQPVGRATVLIGRWLGESAALAGTIVLGLGIGGGIVAFGSGTDGLPQFTFFVLASIVLAVIFLSIAAAIASASEKRVVALGVGTFARKPRGFDPCRHAVGGGNPERAQRGRRRLRSLSGRYDRGNTCRDRRADGLADSANGAVGVRLIGSRDL